MKQRCTHTSACYISEIGRPESNITLDKAVGKTLYGKDWVVYAKRPFGNPMQVIEYTWEDIRIR